MEISPQVQQTLFLIVMLAIGTFGTGIFYQLFKFVRAQVKLVRAKLTEAQNAQIDVWVGIVVKAIEQANLKEGFEQTADEKLNWAVEQLQSIAKAWGFPEVSIEEWVARIRQAVADGWHKAEVEETAKSE